MIIRNKELAFALCGMRLDKKGKKIIFGGAEELAIEKSYPSGAKAEEAFNEYVRMYRQNVPLVEL